MVKSNSIIESPAWQVLEQRAVQPLPWSYGRSTLAEELNENYLEDHLDNQFVSVRNHHWLQYISIFVGYNYNISHFFAGWILLSIRVNHWLVFVRLVA